MHKFEKLILLTSLFVVGLLLLSACSAEQPDIAAATEPPSGLQVPTTRSEVPRISAEELKERLDSGEAIIVADTRSTTSFENNHIAGAISIPAGEVEARLDELPLDQEIVLYCS